MIRNVLRNGWKLSFAASAIAMALTALPASAQNADPKGVLRRALDLTPSGGVSFDPVTMGTGDTQYPYLILDGLLRRNEDGTFSPGLAVRVDVSDPRTMRVQLRDGLKFSDGEVLDALAAKNSIERNIRSNNARGLRMAELGMIDAVEVYSSTVFGIKLKTPSIGLFYPLLADAETAPVSPNSIKTNTPTSKTIIGAGPFKVDNYTLNSKLTLSKNPNYWNAANVKLAGVEIVNASGGPGYINALKSKAADWATLGSFTDAEAMTGDLKASIAQTNYPYWVNFCIRDGTPLANLKVRQALNHATDRQDINMKLYKGKSAPAWTLFPDNNFAGNPAMKEVYKYDPARAKALLAEAGFPNGLKLVIVGQRSPGIEAWNVSQIIQAQWEKAGVQVEMLETQNQGADWYTTPKGHLNVVPVSREGVSRLTRLFISSAFANVCKFQVPDVDKVATELSGLGADDKRAQPLWKQVTKTVSQDLAYGVTTVYALHTIGYNDARVGGLAYHLDSLGNRQVDFAKAYIKAK